ncbi:MAG: efflux RND transporter periplasmic adaptor subunit [Bacteroidales bacterium]|jgi:RND family efflux transporter MFP subunit|nr:efflux RND transporter periplasmic adaptor subunit [Bacteroidales bacterium]
MKKITLMLLLVTLLVAACTGDESGETAQKEYQVKVATIERAIVRQDFEFTGNIEPMYKNNISSSAAQRIEKVYAEVGTRVKRGQLLVEMENINYASARIQLENLKLDLSRIEALYRAGGVAEQQYDQIKTQVKISEESLANLAKNTRLLSPIDGIVVQKNFDSGDLATGMPILVVMQMQPVKILINISEEYFPQVKSGTPVEVSLDIYPEKRFKGSVMLVHPVVDPNTRTFVAEVRINNPALEIRPGMFARARVDFGTKERVVVPDRAVVKQSGTNDKYVYVLDGDVVHFTKVELGRRIGPIYEVFSGIEAGDKVVIAGNSSLKDKATVKVVESALDLTL